MPKPLNTAVNRLCLYCLTLLRSTFLRHKPLRGLQKLISSIKQLISLVRSIKTSQEQERPAVSWILDKQCHSWILSTMTKDSSILENMNATYIQSSLDVYPFSIELKAILYANIWLCEMFKIASKWWHEMFNVLWTPAISYHLINHPN